jgi:carbon-monoxide dehydrogenase small subunit
MSIQTNEITLTVNGTEHELETEPRRLLIDVLRNDLGYTSPKVGCESSKCGACTIHVDGEAVKSCTLLAVRADGAEVRTVADLGEGDDLDPLQESFQEEHGLQCGYCTPGVLMTASKFLEEEDDPSREEIREELYGNICRCTGYQNIVNAIESVANGDGDRVSATEGAD